MLVYSSAFTLPSTLSKKLIHKRSILLVSQIVAEGTKVNLCESMITHVDVTSFAIPNNKYLVLFVD